jgi:hypothetical protein
MPSLPLANNEPSPLVGPITQHPFRLRESQMIHNLESLPSTLIEPLRQFLTVAFR